ncbi:hypothetical protein YC2023_117326 [Brassica napus]|uniref:Uncharacterized protein n=1 Tax=Brassica oleracea TaxID=3712 RepID=A0A3P6DWX4_BRAOL|nr:unnamed protein product [Brassica oleracea]
MLTQEPLRPFGMIIGRIWGRSLTSLDLLGLRSQVFQLIDLFLMLFQRAHGKSRSRNPVLRRLRQSLPSQIPDINSLEDDYYMLRNSSDDPPSVFSTSNLWTSIQ